MIPTFTLGLTMLASLPAARAATTMSSRKSDET
jgi:hypothetical protein